MSKKKVLAAIPADIQQAYELTGKEHLKALTFEDINNVGQALMETSLKEDKPGGSCCSCTMCCAAAVTGSLSTA